MEQALCARLDDAGKTMGRWQPSPHEALSSREGLGPSGQHWRQACLARLESICLCLIPLCSCRLPKVKTPFCLKVLPILSLWDYHLSAASHFREVNTALISEVKKTRPCLSHRGIKKIKCVYICDVLRKFLPHNKCHVSACLLQVPHPTLWTKCLSSPTLCLRALRSGEVKWLAQGDEGSEPRHSGSQVHVHTSVWGCLTLSMYVMLCDRKCEDTCLLLTE